MGSMMDIFKELLGSTLFVTLPLLLGGPLLLIINHHLGRHTQNISHKAGYWENDYKYFTPTINLTSNPRDLYLSEQWNTNNDTKWEISDPINDPSFSHLSCNAFHINHSDS